MALLLICNLCAPQVSIYVPVCVCIKMLFSDWASACVHAVALCLCVYLLFRKMLKKEKKKVDHSRTLRISNCDLSYVDKYTYLGIILDQQM